MKLFKLAFSLLLFLSLGCQKADDRILVDDPAVESIFLIKKIATDDYTQTFHYDDDNRLVRYMSFRNNQLNLIYDYTYLDDFQRKLSITAFHEEEKFEATGIETFNQQYQPENTLGLAINVRNSIVETDEEDNTFTYDEAGRIIRWDCHMNNELAATANYEVAENGDIIKKTITGITLPIDNTTTYEYDRQKHYTHYSKFGFAGDPMQHNITKFTQTDGQITSHAYTATFEYNEVGLPIKEVRRPISGKTMTFYYEYEVR